MLQLGLPLSYCSNVVAANFHTTMSEKVTEQPIDAAPIESTNAGSKESAGVKPSRAAIIKQLANTEGNELKEVTIKKVDVTDEVDRNNQPYKQVIVRLADGSDILCSNKLVVNGEATHGIGRTDTIRMPFNAFIAPFDRSDVYAPVIDKIREFAELGSITDFFLNLKIKVLSVTVKAGVAYNNPLRRNDVSEAVTYDRVFIDVVGVSNITNPVIDESLATAKQLIWKDRLAAIAARREAAAAAAKAAAAVTTVNVEAAF